MIFVDYLLKFIILGWILSVCVFPKETGELWRSRYDNFMIGWNSHEKS